MIAALVLLQVHRAFAWVVVIGNALAGLWALSAHRWPALRTRALWWYTIAVQVSIFIEVTFGVALLNVEKIDPPQFHLLYGFAGIIAVGIIYSYKTSSPWVRQNIYLVYGGTGLFLMGCGIRAMLVAGR